jgi:hypothetical protein
VKAARPVPRGPRRSNAPGLPDWVLTLFSGRGLCRRGSLASHRHRIPLLSTRVPGYSVRTQPDTLRLRLLCHIVGSHRSCSPLPRRQPLGPSLTAPRLIGVVSAATAVCPSARLRRSFRSTIRDTAAAGVVVRRPSCLPGDCGHLEVGILGRFRRAVWGRWDRISAVAVRAGS